MHVPSTNQIYFSMYLYAQEQQLPLGPGIEWKLNNKTFRKSVMISQVSFVQIQWLQMVQESDICCDSNGNRIQMQNAYFQNEIEMNGYKIDGYICRDGVHVFFEFLGKNKPKFAFKYNCSKGVSFTPTAVSQMITLKMPT